MSDMTVFLLGCAVVVGVNLLFVAYHTFLGYSGIRNPIEIKETIVNHFLTEGKRQIEEGRIEEARASMKRVLECDPQNIEGRLLLEKINSSLPKSNSEQEVNDSR